MVVCANGETYTWGSNSYGQLGVGDLLSRGAPAMTRLPPSVRVVQVAAGSNHTIFLTSSGQIYSCGDFQVIPCLLPQTVLNFYCCGLYM